ncbi:MAG: C4-dicarboxylate transporter DctA [Tepidisphaeraceae bacterium]|jgi:DAACS family dicarboxylate/amino acid:cation (Na+ or H+) symporter/aerobic C4-dicarboxylate transport protein
MPPATRRKNPLGQLWVQLLIGLLLGIAVGCAAGPRAAGLKILADLFIRLIRMVLPPIIFGTVAVGIAKMGNLKTAGRVGLKALIYFEIVSTFALVIGLVVVNVVKPGAGMHVNVATLNTHAIDAYTAAGKKQTAQDFLINIIPTSAVGAFVEGTMLQVILLSVLFGVALSRLGQRKQQLIEILDLFVHVLFGVVRIVMYLAPLAAFGSMAAIIGQYGTHTLASYGKLMAGVYLTCIVFIFGVLGIIAASCRVSLWKFLAYIKDEIAVTFGTCSTEAVLPQMMLKMEKLGCEKSLVEMVLPAGYTFNADGTSIYLTMAAIFVAQATDTHLSLGDQLLVLAVLLLTSKGSAGVAGSGFVTLAATLASMDKIPVGGIVLLLGIESFVNQARAVTNLIGNGVATIAVARWENAFDEARARAMLDSPPREAVIA